MFSMRLMSRFQDELKSQYIAHSAARYAASIIAKDETTDFDGTGEIWFNDEYKFRGQSFGEGEFTISNETYDWASGQMKVRYGVIDENKKINLNTADKNMLKALFEVAAKLEEGAAREFADVIMDWRDTDSNRRPFGAEKYDYMAGENSYECPDAPFQSIEELQLLKGMTPEIYELIAPYVTVFGDGQINLNTASPVVLSTMGISEQAVNYIYAARIGGDSVEGTEDDTLYNSPAAAISSFSDFIAIEDVTKLAELNSAKVLGVKAEAFSFMITSVIDQTRGILKIDCVIDRKGNILSWFER